MTTITPTRRLRHDLRTPVNHILGYSQLLIEDSQESGNGGRFPQLEELAGLGQDILRQIELALPSPEPEDPEQRIAHLRHSLKPRVEQIRERLRELPFSEGSAQFADVQRLRQAANKLAIFVDTGSLESTPAATTEQKVETEKSPAEHLLVVDDDSTNRDLLARMLKRLKFRVSVASSAVEALELAGKQSFDLILLDLVMPGMGGHEVLQRLKFTNPDLPVIVISALNDMDTVVQCISSGAEDYFVKPFEAVLLRARIGAALDRRKFRRQLVEQQRLASLGELTARIAHELTNPVNFVLNFSSTAADAVNELKQLMRAESLEARALLTKLCEDLEKIREHGERTSKILNSVLSQCHNAATQTEPAN
jgi:DNA-binding response OmpR family regulator